MRTQSIDTDIKAERVLISLLQEKSPAKKFSLVRSLSKSVIQLSKRAIQRANKGIDDDQRNLIFIELHYGRELAEKLQKHMKQDASTPDILTALNPVVEAFGQLSIPYYIGGSLASSIHGMARATMDIDIIADIKEYHVSKLKEHLEEGYHIDEDTIIEAIKTSSSFNLVHFDTALKIDIFIYRDEPHQQSAIERKIKDKFDEEGDLEYYFSAPEDIIIAKLQWFEEGNRVSERQWLDILGVIKVQGQDLDTKYLVTWSKKLGLFDLLKEAFQESGIDLRD